MKKNARSLSVQDLIILGVCFILYFFNFVIAVHVTVLFAPVLYPLIPAILAILEGFVFLLLITKAPKFGVITIFSILLSFTVMIFGHGSFILIGPIFGFLADIVLRNKHGEWKYTVISYCLFALWAISINIQLYFSLEAFNSNPTFAQMGPKFTQTVVRVMPAWSVPIMILATILGALIGIYWGRYILRKVSVVK